MKKFLSALLLFAAGAWAQNTTSVTASNITNLDGVKVASGKLCFLGTNSNDVPVSFQMGGGGQVTRTPRCTTITNGAVGTFSVPNPANTSPANINYRITVQDDASGEVLTYRKVNFSGASFNFDTYVPDVGTVTSGTSVDNLIAQTFSLSTYADLTRISAPTNPPSGKLRVFADNSTGKLACLDSSGANCNPGGGGGGGDVSSNTSTSVDGEIALFSGTLGKTIKRATTSGILKGTSGVLGAATAGTDYVAPSTTITVNGTANEIASSAGAQDLSANRSWTLSLPSAIDLSGKTSLKLPVSAGASPTASGQIAYDSIANLFKGGVNGVTKSFAFTDSNITGTAANVTGTVATGNGGTGLTSAADDNVLIGNGSVWQSKVLPSCSNPTSSKLLYDTATNAFSCGTDQTGAGGSGITTLNSLTATTQDFSKVDDTNVTLGISSAGSTHTFSMGWTGLLGLGRGGTGANLSATGGAGKVLKQTSVGGAVTVANLASTELSDFSSSPCATNGQIPIWNISTLKYECSDPVVSGAQPAATTQNITATGAGAAVSVAGYGNVRVTVRGAYSGANISFEASPDGSNWFSVQGARDDSAAVESSTGALTNTTRSWAFNVAGFTQFRLNTTTITSGTVNATITPVYIPIEKAIAAQVVSLPSLPAGSNVIGAVTQSGTWNVTVNAALPAGSNTIGGVNLAQYTPVSGRLPVDGSGVTQPVNLAQVAGTAVDTNSGNKSAGTQRVVIASDQPVLAGVGAGATGSAPPANAVQQGGTDGTNLVAIYVDPCERGARTRVAINQTANAQLITGTASKQTYICDLDVVTATAQNIALVEGTGTTCGTGTAGMAGGATAATGWNFAANGGLVKGSGGKWVYKTNTAADNVCLLQSGSGQVSGSLSYVQY